jgi:hypothetical protein
MIREEFSFSGRDAERSGEVYHFSRRVRDLLFLDATYIRVYNHGTDGWAGSQISVWIDNTPLLKEQLLYPLTGAQKMGGIEHFNRDDWKERKYWQVRLQEIRRKQ